MNRNVGKIIRFIGNRLAGASPFLAVLAVLAIPDMAFASGGITEFAGPVQKVVDTLTGPVGKSISILGMVLVGVYFIYQKDDISGGAKMLLSVVFGICFIAFGSTIVTSVFGFSGAMV
jgi:type IV secretion system protein VirB2